MWVLVLTDTEEEAAAAYDTASINYRGRNAMTNFDINNYDVNKILSAESFRLTGNHSKRLKLTETSATKRLPKSCLQKINSVDPQIDATSPNMDATSRNMTASVVQDQQNSQHLSERSVNLYDISRLPNQTMLSSSDGEILENGLHGDFVYMVDAASTGAAYYVPRTLLIPTIHYQYGKAPQFLHMEIPNPVLQNLHVPTPTSQNDIAPTAQFHNVK